MRDRFGIGSLLRRYQAMSNVMAITRFSTLLVCALAFCLGASGRPAAAESYPFEMRLANNVLGEKLFKGEIAATNGRFEQTVSSGNLRVRLTGTIDGDTVSVYGELLTGGNWRFFPFSTEGSFSPAGTFSGAVFAERNNGPPARGKISITRPAPAVAETTPTAPAATSTVQSNVAATTAQPQVQPQPQAQPQIQTQTAVIVPPEPEEPALDRAQRAEVQEQLRVLGHYASAIDGDFGPGTRKAIKSFQRTNALEATGYLTEATLVQLATTAGVRERELAVEQQAAERRAAEERAAQQLAEQRAAEQRAAEERAAQQLAEQRAAEEAARQQAAIASVGQPDVATSTPTPDLAAVVPTLQPIDESFVAVKPANVRAAPAVTADLVAALNVGESIDVLGRLPGEDWYVVARDGKPIGYVVLSQLAPQSTAAVTQSGSLTLPTELAALDYGRYHAVVIGNNAYRSLPKLNTATTDAKAVADVLEKDYGYDVTLLTDASEETIVGTFASLRRTLTENDNLLVYYAGHGWFDEEAERGYWLPVDAVADNQSNWISNADVTDMLKAIKAKHVLVVADSCYSGTLTRGLAIGGKSPGYYHAILDRRARTVLTSGGLEPVLDAGGGRHSVFAKAFLETLQGNTGVIDGEGVFQRVRDLVILNAEQVPEYGNIRLAGHDGGDFLFVRKPQ
jgi:peptidoglycan hydrolase-like protein with peptidoglycan-binding domain